MSISEDRGLSLFGVYSVAQKALEECLYTELLPNTEYIVSAHVETRLHEVFQNRFKVSISVDRARNAISLQDIRVFNPICEYINMQVTSESPVESNIGVDSMFKTHKRAYSVYFGAYIECVKYISENDWYFIIQGATSQQRMKATVPYSTFTWESLP